MTINGIIACCNNVGIGLNNKLPWHLKEDLIRFKKTTIGQGNNCVIMGAKTWEGLTYLKGRDHLILSNKLDIDYTQFGNTIKSFKTINELLIYIKKRNYDESWLIGGSNILKQFLDLNLLDRIYITLIDEPYECDVFLPEFPANYFKTKHTMLPEKTKSGKNVYMVILDQIKSGMKIVHNNSFWVIEKIHFEDNPNIYFTIKDGLGREKQTIKEKIELIL